MVIKKDKRKPKLSTRDIKNKENKNNGALSINESQKNITNITTFKKNKMKSNIDQIVLQERKKTKSFENVKKSTKKTKDATMEVNESEFEKSNGNAKLDSNLNQFNDELIDPQRKKIKQKFKIMKLPLSNISDHRSSQSNQPVDLESELKEKLSSLLKAHQFTILPDQKKQSSDQNQTVFLRRKREIAKVERILRNRADVKYEYLTKRERIKRAQKNNSSKKPRTDKNSIMKRKRANPEIKRSGSKEKPRPVNRVINRKKISGKK